MFGLQIPERLSRLEKEVEGLTKENEKLKWTIYQLQSDLKRFEKEEFKTLKDDTHY